MQPTAIFEVQMHQLLTQANAFVTLITSIPIQVIPKIEKHAMLADRRARDRM